MTLRTEPVGSIPRPSTLVAGLVAEGEVTDREIDALYEDAVRDTISRFEETGSPVVTDGEQRKPSFATYPVHGLERLAPDGVVIPFADGHTRRLPVLTGGPFKYRTYADRYLETACKYTRLPIKQAVISASALSLLYPAAGLPGYPREAFLEDLVREAETDIRRCLDRGAHCVQIDFTEARLSLKLDPSGGLLRSFIELNNQVIGRFGPAERQRLGVHTCPGGDRDSTHSADVDYAALLPELFKLEVGNFYVQLASERDRERVLKALAPYAVGDRTIFVGVIDPIHPEVETPHQVRDRVLEAARFIDPAHLGTTDDCGFAPFGDDVSTSRDTAFAKIRARVLGTELASQALGL